MKQFELGIFEAPNESIICNLSDSLKFLSWLKSSDYGLKSLGYKLVYDLMWDDNKLSNDNPRLYFQGYRVREIYVVTYNNLPDEYDVTYIINCDETYHEEYHAITL